MGIVNRFKIMIRKIDPRTLFQRDIVVGVIMSCRDYAYRCSRHASHKRWCYETRIVLDRQTHCLTTVVFGQQLLPHRLTLRDLTFLLVCLGRNGDKRAKQNEPNGSQ